MKHIFIYLSICICTSLYAQSYSSYITGDTTDVNTGADYGICLMGGSTEDDRAMKWFLEKANGGDIIVIRTSESDGYNDYFFSELDWLTLHLPTCIYIYIHR